MVGSVINSICIFLCTLAFLGNPAEGCDVNVKAGDYTWTFHLSNANVTGPSKSPGSPIPLPSPQPQPQPSPLPAPAPTVTPPSPPPAVPTSSPSASTPKIRRLLGDPPYMVTVMTCHDNPDYGALYMAMKDNADNPRMLGKWNHFASVDAQTNGVNELNLHYQMSSPLSTSKVNIKCNHNLNPGNLNFMKVMKKNNNHFDVYTESADVCNPTKMSNNFFQKHEVIFITTGTLLACCCCIWFLFFFIVYRNRSRRRASSEKGKAPLRMSETQQDLETDLLDEFDETEKQKMLSGVMVMPEQDGDVFQDATVPTQSGFNWNRENVLAKLNSMEDIENIQPMKKNSNAFVMDVFIVFQHEGEKLVADKTKFETLGAIGKPQNEDFNTLTLTSEVPYTSGWSRQDREEFVSEMEEVQLNSIAPNHLVTVSVSDENRLEVACQLRVSSSAVSTSEGAFDQLYEFLITYKQWCLVVLSKSRPIP